MTTQGRELRKLRERRGWSQKQLATEADVSQGQISEVEAGKAGIGPDVAQRLGRALGVEWTLFFRPDVRKSISRKRNSKGAKA